MEPLIAINVSFVRRSLHNPLHYSLKEGGRKNPLSALENEVTLAGFFLHRELRGRRFHQISCCRGHHQVRPGPNSSLQRLITITETLIT